MDNSLAKQENDAASAAHHFQQDSNIALEYCLVLLPHYCQVGVNGAFGAIFTEFEFVETIC